MTTIVRWPLRFGLFAIVTVDAEPEDTASIDPRPVHRVDCLCVVCIGAIVAPPVIAAGADPRVA